MSVGERVCAICCACLFAAVGHACWYVLLGTLVLHGDVDRRSLAVSVGSAVGSADGLLGGPSPCVRRGARTWTCSVTDGSAGSHYRVRVRAGSSCWDARRTGPAYTLFPAAASGCVHRLEWTLADVLTLE